MTDITRLGADKLGRPKKSGPEQYAPPDRRAQVSDVDQAAVNAVEGEIREFVRRDHQQRSKADAANDPAPEKLNELIRRVPALRPRKSTRSFSNCNAYATCCTAKANA
jgi:hypothetical protein